MKSKYIKYLVFLIISVFLNISFCYAATYVGTVTGTSVNARSGPGTNYGTVTTLKKDKSYKLVTSELFKSESECTNGWYQIEISTNSTGYVCSNYLSITVIENESDIEYEKDDYDRPWTSPKSTIIGGAKFIGEKYIRKGQFTAYLKKFNVNPNSSYNVYNHQYMANLQAPASEAKSTYNSYRDNGLLLLPLEFTIPIFDNMPDYTLLPDTTYEENCKSEITDNAFEEELNKENFPESYKCKLRLIHDKYPNWKFYSMMTNLDFDKSVKAEQKVCSIQGSSKYHEIVDGKRVETETNWFLANLETVAYFLDPRNFLTEQGILMFEDLSYSENYTAKVVSSVLNGTFMKDYSLLDNMLYSDIFVEAGVSSGVSPVYLASLARQESGVKGGIGTTGEEFTYKGITYKGLYNFYNIGANSGAESPVLAGLVWASGGSSSVIIKRNDAETENNNVEKTIMDKLGASLKDDCLINIKPNTKLSELKEKLSGFTVTVDGLNDEDFVRTNSKITISDGANTFTYTISVIGDVNGDGEVGASDYVLIKNYIMEKVGSSLNTAESLSADVDGNGEVGASDYVLIKKSIMEG